MIVASEEATSRRLVFFEAIFEGLTGFVCVATRRGGTKVFHEEFFEWPGQVDQMLQHILGRSTSDDVWYCPTLLSRPQRTKENVANSNVVWADLDACSPEQVRLQPTFAIETSPNRYQALWKMDEAIVGWDAEDYARRIAYTHADEGADRSGWDLTQLLRVPFTTNFKYGSTITTGPMIKVIQVNDVTYTTADLEEAYPQVEGLGEAGPVPDVGDLPGKTGEELMQEYRTHLQPLAFHLFATTPEKDWSKPLWQLQLFCFEAGMSREEVFVVARDSACNKFLRNNVSMNQLWKDVCRADNKFRQQQVNLGGFIKEHQPLLSTDERARVAEYSTFVEEYIAWARTIGDAAPQYHEAGAFVILSALMSGAVKLPTSFGTVLPNLWFMILADTTLTRKSTAMDLAMDLLVEVDADCIVATDGSVEGLFSALSYRPGRPSVFLRDEFSGLVEAMTRKDYYAGMAETLTKLYDGKYQKRQLRKETIEVKDPVLILFAGGIRDRVLSLLTYEHVGSGFLPRFVFITAESDIARVRPLGPPTDRSLGRRAELLKFMERLHGYYHSVQQTRIGERTVAVPRRWECSLSPEAWLRYNQFETDMMQAALESRSPELMTPMFDRLAKSALKCALLIAATRCQDEVVVNELDLLKAIQYTERWREFTVDILHNIGRTTSERLVGTVLRYIERKDGVLRSELMQVYHLDARTAESILATLEQRGQISRVKSGRTERLHKVNVRGAQ